MAPTTLPAIAASNATSSPASAPARTEPGHSVVDHLQRTPIYRDYLGAYETTTGLPLALRPVGTFNSPIHQSKQLNPFCALMARNNQACAACLRMQQQIETDATSEAATFQCFAGLTESAAPIHVGAKLIGHLQTGQVLLQKPTKARFAKIREQLAAWGAQVDLEKLETAYFATRVIAKKQYDSMVRLLSVFAQHLGELSNQMMVREAAAESPSVTRARAFIAEHQQEDLTLDVVARAVGMSSFYFCKIFKRATGLTFTDYLARVRVETVKQLLLNPHTRISEAAYAAGFQSLSQFNRVFRRVAGEAPTAYREHLHGPDALHPLAHAA